jgi:hypothetical protein
MSAAAEKALENTKLNNTMTQATIDAANALPLHDAEAAARAITPKLTGATAAADLRYLPAGALDPCGVDPSKLNNDDIKVTSAPAISDIPSASECVYTFAGAQRGEPGTGQLAVYTLTTPQAAAAQPPTTPAAVYAKTVAGYASRGGYRPSGAAAGDAPYGTATSGPLSMAGMTSGEPDFAMLAGPANASATTTGLMLRIWDYRSTYVIDQRHCYEEIRALFNELQREAAASDRTIDAIIGAPAADAAREKLAGDIADWCRKQEETNERPPAGAGG